MLRKKQQQNRSRATEIGILGPCAQYFDGNILNCDDWKRRHLKLSTMLPLSQIYSPIQSSAVTSK